MCGFAGVVCREQVNEPELHALVEEMADRINHRGPDDADTFIYFPSRIAMAFRRLSIIDLSAAGRQPMQSGNGRFSIVFNGEIYNFRELRKELDSVSGLEWVGHSDTEVLLRLIEVHGIEKAVSKLDGMFAIAVYDKHENSVTLVRDPFGEKPLYYSIWNEGIAFGSEISAVTLALEGKFSLDGAGLAQVLRYGYISSPSSVFAGVQKVAPGSILTIRLGAGFETISNEYWNACDEFLTQQQNVFSGSRSDATEILMGIIDEVTLSRLEADVGVGAFLSGGMDSSTVVASIVAQGRSIDTFCMGFSEPNRDESGYAKAVADVLGTNHHRFELDEQKCIEIVPKLCEIYDEPFADASAIPTVLLCQETRKHVKVVVSGDGGDELFGGYSRYFGAQKKLESRSKISKFKSQSVAAIAALSKGKSGQLHHRVRKFAKKNIKLGASQICDTHASWWDANDGMLLTLPNVSNTDRIDELVDAGFSVGRSLMVNDVRHYLGENLLTKTDRASMRFSLECRSPLLSKKLARFVWSLPDEYTLTDRRKGILREALLSRLPENLVDRPKYGFEPPLTQWLRGPLKDWAAELSFNSKLAEDGYIDKTAIEWRARQHFSGKRNWAYPLWTFLMAESWYRRWFVKN